jgi:hypothetical protein
VARRRKVPKISEAEYAQTVIEHFEAAGYEVFKEVAGPGKIRADIYCKRGNETIAIEVKTSLNLKVIDQAYRWRPYANKVYIAIPYQKYLHYKIAAQICEDYGFGILSIYKESRHGIKDLLVEKLGAKVNVSPKEPMLHEDQKDSEAGTKGSYVTPFKITCKTLIQLIRDKGPMPLKTATTMIQHHYKNDSSANQSLRKMIVWGVIDELELFKEGRAYGVRIKKEYLEDS